MFSTVKSFLPAGGLRKGPHGEGGRDGRGADKRQNLQIGQGLMEANADGPMRAGIRSQHDRRASNPFAESRTGDEIVKHVPSSLSITGARDRVRGVSDVGREASRKVTLGELRRGHIKVSPHGVRGGAGITQSPDLG
eukprot:6191041-Pyramimonas_sp.AAC.1